MPQPKIFCIGFHKTGTSSLGRALRMLGYNVRRSELSDFKTPRAAQEILDFACAQAEQYEAFRDNPWPVVYQEMDRRFPGSKFILTVRPGASWINSVVRHFGAETTPMREWIYGAGCPQGNEAIYLARYERHNREVLEYFRDRPDDLLVMNLAANEGWEKLCRFLGKEIPRAPFPHVHKAESRERNQQETET